MRACETVNPIQVFAPNPSKTTTLTLTGGTATWTPPGNTRVFAIYASDVVQIRLNSNTYGLSADASTIAGPFGLHSATQTVTFTGVAGTTVIVEAD